MEAHELGDKEEAEIARQTLMCQEGAASVETAMAILSKLYTAAGKFLQKGINAYIRELKLPKV